MKLTVEVVSASGLGIKSGGQWFNRAKQATFPTFTGLTKGTEIEADVRDGKWINDFTVLTAGTGTSSTTKTYTAVAGGNTAKDAMIVRTALAKEAVGVLTEAILKTGKDYSELVVEVDKLLAHYTELALNGPANSTGGTV